MLPSDRHADWLLWEVPALRGRIAYDIRFELLTHAELVSLARFKAVRPGWQRAAAGYPILVLDPTEDRRRIPILRGQGLRVLYGDDAVVVLKRPS